MKGSIVLLSAERSCDGYIGALHMPLSAMAIGSVLKAESFEPHLIDVQIEPDWPNALRRALPGSVFFGVSCLTGPAILDVLKALNIARREFPQIPVVWGGYHATQAYREILKEGLVDYVVRGPGEEAVVGLAKALACRGLGADLDAVLKNVTNLAYMGQAELVVNPFRTISDMNALPPMDYDLIDVWKYYSGKRRRLDYVSSYGCHNRCTFCTEPNHNQRRWQGLRPERVVDEWAYLRKKYAPDRIYIQDSNFSSDPRRVVAIAQEMKRCGEYIELFCDMRPRDVLRVGRLVDLRVLREVGFVDVFIGVESGSDRMLSMLKKDSMAADALMACRTLDQAGIGSLASFVHDLPGENMADSDETFRLIEELCQLKRHEQTHHFFMPYPGADLYREVFRAGKARRERTQRDWADTSLFYGSDVWQGRARFREGVLKRLQALRAAYPSALPSKGLPVLRSPTPKERPEGDVSLRSRDCL